MKSGIEALNAITDKVLAYGPSRKKAGKSRKTRKTGSRTKPQKE